MSILLSTILGYGNCMYCSQWGRGDILVWDFQMAPLLGQRYLPFYVGDMAKFITSYLWQLAHLG